MRMKENTLLFQENLVQMDKLLSDDSESKKMC